MAKDMGITHQKLDRWLREGEAALIDPSTGDTLRKAGIKQIPDDLFTQQAINEIYNAHKARAKRQAKIDDIPFDENFPVFQFKKPREDGRPSDRTFVIGTEYLDKITRNDVIKGLARSKKYYELVGRSIINLSQYNRQAEKRFKGWPPRTEAQQEAKKAIARQIRAKETLGAIYTKRTRLGPVSPTAFAQPYEYIKEFNTKVAEKHEPATGEKGTALVDQLIFQLIPGNFKIVQSKAKPKRRAKK